MDPELNRQFKNKALTPRSFRRGRPHTYSIASVTIVEHPRVAKGVSDHVPLNSLIAVKEQDATPPSLLSGAFAHYLQDCFDGVRD